MRTYRLLIITVSFALVFSACADTGNQNTANNSNANTTAEVKPAATPSNQITEADVSKLKWLEGTWRGMDGDKPFFERIKFEGSKMTVETFEDGTLAKVTESGVFELTDGEFAHTTGDSRSAVSSITDDKVQFVPARIPGSPEGVPVKGHTFRFERQADATWLAILEVPAKRNEPASEKVYKMEPWKAEAKQTK